MNNNNYKISSKIYLEELVRQWYDFESLGDLGKLLMTRFYSVLRGLNHSNARIKHEIELWAKSYNRKYVRCICFIPIPAEINTILFIGMFYW